jgi:hypothetical protein
VVHCERGANALMISEQAAAAGLTSPRFAAHAPPLLALTDVCSQDFTPQNHTAALTSLFDHCCCCRRYRCSLAVHTLLQVLVVHGERGANSLMISEQAAAAGLTSPRFAAHAPPLPITFGTHHSKAFLLGYRHGGLRLIVHTANLMYPDCNNKTQGLWYQVRLGCCSCLSEVQILGGYKFTSSA